MKPIMMGIVAAAMLVVIAGGVAEAKGPKGPNGGTATLSVAALAAPATVQGAETSGGLVAGGEWYVIQGSGFTADQPVYLVIREPFCCAATTLMVSGDGTFAILRSTRSPGTYSVDAMVKQGNRMVTVATVSFEVAGNQ